jgi:hypothetical protein
MSKRTVREYHVGVHEHDDGSLGVDVHPAGPCERAQADRTGPAKVNSAAYQTGWDVLFGSQKRGSA